MNAHTASLINASLLILLGSYGYFTSESPSPTAFIPVVCGVFLLAMYNGIKKENKMIAHIAVLITLLIALALFMPLRRALTIGDQGAIFRVGLMLASSILAMFYFIKSFIDARKNRS
ncbi:MAG TPA: hypothetical protein PKC30_02525 [Saprospiraceae bacterium]|nr:hypothetical protein [Saprospiraceae bacterium]